MATVKKPDAEERWLRMELVLGRVLEDAKGQNEHLEALESRLTSLKEQTADNLAAANLRLTLREQKLKLLWSGLGLTAGFGLTELLRWIARHF